MTIPEAKNRLVAWCNSQVGYHESGDNWNKYAESEDLVKWYGWKPQKQPWCDTFADSAFLACFGLEKAAKMTYQPIGKGTALCSASANCYKANGAWYEKPEVGDQVFFLYGGGINHVGIVVSVGMGAIATIEGNSSDRVARNTYSCNSPSIAGYGRPNWNVISGGAIEVPETPSKPEESYCAYSYNVKTNLLKKGNYGPQVLNMQHLLKAHGFADWEPDGKFGDKTLAAVKAFQKAAKISVDGEWGGESFNAMWNYSKAKNK